MNSCRTSPLPVLYTKLRFVRFSSAWRIFADCPEDLPYLHRVQSVAQGHTCVAQLEQSHELLLKAEFPADILERDGSSEEVIRWRAYCWKLWDVHSLIGDRHLPAEAIQISEAGVDFHFIGSLAHPISCLPMLRKTQEVFPQGYTLTQEIASALERMETPLIASLQLHAMKMKQLKPAANSSSRPIPTHPRISSSLRDEILRRDGYRCIFCGQGSSEASLEVNHIIPRSLIDKLHLGSSLHTSPHNLCVACFACNRGKRDNLRAEDIGYYRSRFSDKGHPNHDILPHLKKLSELQDLE